MKPAKFDYLRPAELDEALEALSQYGDEAKIIAGGQSLMPMLNYRLVKPAVLIDINHIPGLEVIADLGGRLRMGALARHRMTASDALIARRIPVLHHAMHHVAHMTIRNRGTFCGSVCHADPAAEVPMITLLLDGEIEIASATRRRVLAASDFLVGSLVNALEPEEMVTGITIRTSTESSGWGFEEFSRRHGDFALAAVGITLDVDAEGAMYNARIGMTGVGETPLRMHALEAMIEGRQANAALFSDVAQWLESSLTPNDDIHASADYRRNLAGVLAERALRAAHARALHAKGSRI